MYIFNSSVNVSIPPTRDANRRGERRGVEAFSDSNQSNIQSAEITNGTWHHGAPSWLNACATTFTKHPHTYCNEKNYSSRSWKVFSSWKPCFRSPFIYQSVISVCPPDAVPLFSALCFFHSASCCSSVSLKDCYPHVPSHFDVLSGFFFLQLGVQLIADWLSSQFVGGRLQVASAPSSNMWVALIRAVGRSRSASSPSLSSFTSAPLPSVHHQWSRKNQDPDRQHTCTYTHIR